jgi:hypothetical protein
LPGVFAAPAALTYMYLPLVLLLVRSPMGPVLAVGVPLLSTYRSRSSPVRFVQLVGRVPGIPTVPLVKFCRLGKAVTHCAAAY